MSKVPPQGEHGQALVEFALVLPLLMLILIGIIKGGLLFNNYLQVTDATRSGARTLSIGQGRPDACSDAANAVLTAIGGLDRSRVSMTMTEAPEGPNDQPGAVFTWQNGSGSNNASGPNNVSDCGFTLVSGSAVTLRTTYPCDLQIFGTDFAPHCTLSATATERVE